jgi:DNA-binding SARP family transcriptional activator
MLDVQLLGRFGIADAGQRIQAIRNPRLIAYLLLHRDRPVARSEVAFTLWPESSDAQALTNLRRELHLLRHALPDADRFLGLDRATVRWRPDGPFRLDVADFEAAVERVASPDVEALQAAVAAYTGDLLPTVYDDWISPYRDRLRDLMLKTLEALATGLEDRREYRAAIERWERLVAIDPLDEAAYRGLMRVAALAGNRSAGLRAYHACVRALQDDLGVEPSPETMRAYDRLLTLDVSEVPLRSEPEARLQPPLVGRQPEWEALVHASERAAAGTPTVVLLQGEAGIGKSRLIEELDRWARARGTTVLATRAWEAEGALAYAPVIAWLRKGSLGPTLEQLDDVWLSEIARLLPEILADRPGLARPEPMLESWHRQRLFEALAVALRNARPPLLLVLDDANWVDRDTLEWLNFLLRTELLPAVVLLGARSGEVETNDALTTLVSDTRSRDEIPLLDIELGPLTEADTAALAAASTDRQLDASAQAALYRETEGHPLFVVEMARAGLPVATGVVAAGDADLRSSGRVSGMPARMRAVILARLRQLTPTAQHVAGVAATIGHEFDVDLLSDSADLDEPELVAALDELWRRRIVREHGLDRYDFSHDRIREVAATELGPAERRLLHRRIAQALELRHHDDIDPIAAQLAVHLVAAGSADRACDMFERAAAVAARVLATAEAERHLSRALAILVTLPASRDRDLRELRMLLQLSPLLLGIEGYASPRQEASIERARVLAAALGEEVDEWSALNGLWGVHVVGGKVVRSLEVAEAALARSADHPELASASHLSMGGSLTFLGDQSKAVAEFELALATHAAGASRPSSSGSDAAVGAWSWGSHACWLAGRTETAAAWSTRAVERAGSLEAPHLRVLALSYAAILEQLNGDVDAMLKHAAVAIDLCDRYDFAYYREWHRILWAWADRSTRSDSTTRIERALDDLRSIRAMARLPYYQSLLADAHEAARRPARARAALQAALADATSSGEQWWVPELRRRLAILDRGPEGEIELRRALDIAVAQRAGSLALRAAISLAERASSERATLQRFLDAVPEPARQDRLAAIAVLDGLDVASPGERRANDSRTVDLRPSDLGSRRNT